MRKSRDIEGSNLFVIFMFTCIYKVGLVGDNNDNTFKITCLVGNDDDTFKVICCVDEIGSIDTHLISMVVS